jgi:hypothetical protein
MYETRPGPSLLKTLTDLVEFSLEFIEIWAISDNSALLNEVENKSFQQICKFKI